MNDGATGPGNQTVKQYRADCERKRLAKSFDRFLAAQERRVKRMVGGYRFSGTHRPLRPIDYGSRAPRQLRRSEVLQLIYRPGIVNYAHAAGSHHPRLDQLDGERQD